MNSESVISGRFSLLRAVFLSLVVSVPGHAIAQNFTTAAEVKPILQATKASWIAVRLYGGKDLVYFTNLLSWRCGLTEISYAVNGGDVVTFDAEPCYEDSAQPNALKAESLDAILVSFAPDTVNTVTVHVTYDDGSTDQVDYTRAAIEIQ